MSHCGGSNWGGRDCDGSNWDGSNSGGRDCDGSDCDKSDWGGSCKSTGRISWDDWHKSNIFYVKIFRILTVITYRNGTTCGRK
jgi:hypothetical protein